MFANTFVSSVYGGSKEGVAYVSHDLINLNRISNDNAPRVLFLYFEMIGKMWLRVARDMAGGVARDLARGVANASHDSLRFC